LLQLLTHLGMTGPQGCPPGLLPGNHDPGIRKDHISIHPGISDPAGYSRRLVPVSFQGQAAAVQLQHRSY